MPCVPAASRSIEATNSYDISEMDWTRDGTRPRLIVVR